jgi:hypothetical protein
MKSTLKGVEETLECIFSTRKISWDELKDAVYELEEASACFRRSGTFKSFSYFS